MTTLTLSHGTAWLIACTVAANFTMGIYHLMVVLDTIKRRPMPMLTAFLLAGAYAGPPAMLILSVAKATHIL